jgi:hypothetical protein
MFSFRRSCVGTSCKTGSDPELSERKRQDAMKPVGIELRAAAMPHSSFKTVQPLTSTVTCIG